MKHLFFLFIFFASITNAQTSDASKPLTISAEEKPEAELYKGKADVYFNKGNFNEALAYYKQSLKYAIPNNMLSFYLKSKIAESYFLSGEMDNVVIPRLQEAINAQITNEEKCDKEIIARHRAVSYKHLVAIYKRQGNVAKACELSQQAVNSGLNFYEEVKKFCGEKLE